MRRTGGVAISKKASSMLLAKRTARERGILQKAERRRKARIDEAAADVYVRVKARAAAQQAIRDAEEDVGEALRRLLAEKLTLKESAELCALTVSEVRKLSRRPLQGNGNGPAG